MNDYNKKIIKTRLSTKKIPVSRTDEAGVRYRTLFEQSPDGIVLIDTRGRILEFNEAACRQLGYSREEFANLQLSDIDAFESPEDTKEKIRRILDEGKAEFEVRQRTRGGEIRDVNVITRVITLSGQRVFHTIWRDVTESKRAQEELRRREEKFSTLFELANDAVFILDLKGHFIDVNRTAYERLGYSRDEMLSMHISQLDPPEFASRVPERLDQIRKQGNAVFESAHLKKDGTSMPVEINTRIIDYENQKAIFSIVRDITDRKRNENELRQSREALERANSRFQTLLHAIPDVVFFKDPEGRHIVFNKALERFLGRSRREIEGKSEEELLPPDLVEKCRKSDAKVMKGHRLVRLQEETGEGSRKKVIDTIKVPLYDADGKSLGLAGVIRDITEQKKAEEALRLSSNKWRATFDAISDSVCLLDLEGRILQCNRSTANLLGRPFDKIIGSTCWELMHGTSEPIKDCPVKCMQKTHRKESLILPVGSRWVNIVAEPVVEEQSGRIVGAVHIMTDITEQKRAEEAIKESEERLLTILESLEAIVYVADMKTYEIIFANSYAKKMFGDITGTICWQTLQLGQNGPCDFCTNSRIVDEAGNPNGTYEWDFQNTKTGRWYHILDRAVHWVDGSVVRLEIATDITEKKLVEQELKKHRHELQRRASELEHAYKDMESFSFAVSHDLKAPIRRIEGFSDILLQEHAGKLDRTARDLLTRIGDNTDRMRELIDDLLTFSRFSIKEIQRSDINIEQLAKEAFNELISTAGQKEIRLEINPTPPALGDPSMLKQVFLNLLSNSIKFTRTRETALIEVGGYTEGDDNIFYVRDNGIGFDMQFADKLFGLFQRIHTSKQFEGTGVGLVIVKKIVEKHGGRVWAEGMPEKSATFFFSLPRNLPST